MTQHAVSDTWRVRHACRRVGIKAGLHFDTAVLVLIPFNTYLYLLIPYL